MDDRTTHESYETHSTAGYTRRSNPGELEGYSGGVQGEGEPTLEKKAIDGQARLRAERIYHALTRAR